MNSFQPFPKAPYATPFEEALRQLQVDCLVDILAAHPLYRSNPERISPAAWSAMIEAAKEDAAAIIAQTKARADQARSTGRDNSSKAKYEHYLQIQNARALLERSGYIVTH